jgi:putative glycerol-1-phosphate prenyltransferase
MSIYADLLASKAEQKKKFIVLIDPDHVKLNNLDSIAQLASDADIDAFFIGGSLIVNNQMDKAITQLKAICPKPVILFPGGSLQLSFRADALLLLSLISGRNPDLLIGKHVETATFLRMSPLEIISTGYMLIDGGVATSVSYISNTYPIPRTKDDIAVCTAIAGEMLGMKLIFMDAGSGALQPISTNMISAVSANISIPLIIGGGIRSPEKVAENYAAGADIVVVGNAIEKDPNLIKEMAAVARA